MLSPEATLASEHFLRITGVLTGSFGAVLVHALMSSEPQHVAVLWVGIQKIVTAAAVGIAIQDLIFSPLALAAGAFDLISGVMIISFWFWIKQHTKESKQH